MLGMIGSYQRHPQHPSHLPQGYSGLLVRSATSSSESESSTESPEGSAVDRQSPALHGNIHSDPVHDPSPSKSDDDDDDDELRVDDSDDSSLDSSGDEGYNPIERASTQGMPSSATGNTHENGANSAAENLSRPLVIKPEPLLDQSAYSTPLNSRYSNNHSPFDSARIQSVSAWPQNFESPALKRTHLETPPTGQRSQAIKRNFSEAATVHGSYMSQVAAQQAMFNPALMMMAQMTGSEAMAKMGGLGMMPNPWMLQNLAMAAGNHGNVPHNQDPRVFQEGAPLDLSHVEVPAKKLKRTPSPCRSRDEPINLSVSTTSRVEESKKSSLTPGGIMSHRHLEDLVKRQLSQKEALKLQEVLYYEHMVLVTQLTCRSEVEGHHGSFQRLHHIYMMEVDRIEKERYKAIMGNLSDQQRQATLTSYDQERMTLVLRIKQELAMLLGPTQSARPVTQAPAPMIPTPTPQPAMYPMGVMYPWKQNSPPEDDSKDKLKKFLSPGAVKVLAEWYSLNEEHPYPEEETVHQLAMKAQVSPAQVKKWMANKRVRSSNTLSHNGSIHPKKLQKVLQIQEMARYMTSPEQQQQQVDQQRQMMNSSGAKKSKRALNPQAVEAMNRWYFSHLHYPYPTDEEKVLLAQEGNITVAQVTCWFANKRNRSNNAKKFSPVLMTPEDKSVYQGMKKPKGETTTSPSGHPQFPEGYDVAHDQSYAHHDFSNARKHHNEAMTSPNSYHPMSTFNFTPERSHDQKSTQHHRVTTSTSSVSSSMGNSSPDGSSDEGHLQIDEARPQMQSLESPPSPVSH